MGGLNMWFWVCVYASLDRWIKKGEHAGSIAASKQTGGSAMQHLCCCEMVPGLRKSSIAESLSDFQASL
eukprot:309999-Pelagomonas_calceolata.AAC.1